MTSNVLIVCTRNSARSVLSEGMLQLLQFPLDTLSHTGLQSALAAIWNS